MSVFSLAATVLLALSASASPYVPAPRANDAAILSGLPTAYTAAPTAPISAFSSYYKGYEPTQTTAQPQPVISDPVTGKIYPLNLTSAFTVQTNDTADPINYPDVQIVNATRNSTWGINAISAIIAQNSSVASNCTKCLDSLLIAQQVARSFPAQIGDMAIALCIKFAYASAASCRNNYNDMAWGPMISQLLVNGDMTGDNGRLICANQFTSPATCAVPVAAPLNMTGYFAKPKPANASLLVPKASGKRLKVLHTSDLHIDPRYDTGSEAACASGLCCRYGNPGTNASVTTFPAPQFGAFKCDAPYSLILAAFSAIPALTGTQGTGFDFSIFTGDLASHDTNNQLSRDYVLYTESIMYRLMKEYLGTGPLYAAMGNHDQYQQATDAPHAINPGVLSLKNQFSWNYDHLASLWEHEGWISSKVAEVSKAHYGAYSTITPQGLKIITFNTDFWYKTSLLNYINSTNPDLSGTFRWMADELQDAEDKKQRVWIVGHVLSGWDGSNPLTNPSNLWYQIIERYSPHVVANVFFGHTHEDMFSIVYQNNGTVQSRATALTTAWVGPSLTPLTNLNAGFRMYEVDSGDFNVYEAHTWYSNVSEYRGLTSTGPSFHYEYSSRTAYDPNNTWPSTAPLNATFWHAMTENMEKDGSLVQKFNTYQGKTSAMTPSIQNCSSAACQTAKICYMRSASVPIARQNCKLGYGSVQS